MANPLVDGVGTDVWIAAHVEVIMVDVDHFRRFFVFQRVGNWPTVDGSFAEVDRALVVSMMQLRHSDQRMKRGGST